MCQCGCAEKPFAEAFQITGSKVTIAYQIFPGCGDCDYGPGVAFSLFDSPKVEWLDGVRIQKIKPDEYGANEGIGISVGLLDLQDLRKAAKELWAEAQIRPGDDNHYASLDDWLCDYGQRMLENAARLYMERVARVKKDHAKARRP